jgi:hypothetical protein
LPRVTHVICPAGESIGALHVVARVIHRVGETDFVRLVGAGDVAQWLTTIAVDTRRATAACQSHACIGRLRWTCVAGTTCTCTITIAMIVVVVVVNDRDDEKFYLYIPIHCGAETLTRGATPAFDEWRTIDRWT